MSLYPQQKLHILYLIDEIKVKGGSEKHLFELAVGMAHSGLRVTVISLAEGEYAADFRENKEIAYHCLNVKRIYDTKGLWAIFAIARYIRRQHVDVIQTFHAASDLVGPLAARASFTKVGVVSSRRDLGYTKSARHVKMQRLVNGIVDGILANSTAVKRAVIEKEGFPADRVHIIHNGICTESFFKETAVRLAKRASLGIEDETIVIGSVGNIRPVKGYDLLVESAARVIKANPKVLFLHIGEGETRHQLEARCNELGIEEQFRFLGATKDVPSFLASLDIYVQPSRSEGLSNAILEAMAAGVPVVATDVGGNLDIIQHGTTGLLARGEDVGSIAQMILLLVENPQERGTMAKRSREMLKQTFNISRMLKMYETFYLDMISPPA